jgi:hypothetical protein
MTGEGVSDKATHDRATDGRAIEVELRLDKISRLYNSLDPSPFNEKDLDAAADDYIVGAAEDLGGRPMRLVVRLDEDERRRPEAAQIEEAIRHHFVLREQSERRQLRLVLHRGRVSLLIGLVFLTACLLGRQVLLDRAEPFAHIVAEGLLIVGWVAMWGPLDIFLYGWWPVSGRCRLFRRLAKLDVEVKPLR